MNNEHNIRNSAFERLKDVDVMTLSAEQFFSHTPDRYFARQHWEFTASTTKQD
jgi:hypothetical protein